MKSTTDGGVSPSIGSPAPTRRRISDDETSRRGMVTCSNRQPGPGGTACSPARSTTDDRRELPGLLEPAPGRHVGHRVRTEQQEQLAIGRLQALERVGGDRRPVVVELDPRDLDPDEAGARALAPWRTAARAKRPPGPASATDRRPGP